MQAGDTGLIVKTHAFGDALLATPAVARLLERGGRWIALAGPSAAEVWRRMPGMARVEVAPMPPVGPGGLLGPVFWTIAARRRLAGISECVVLHRSGALRRWVRLLTGAPSRSGGQTPLGRWETVLGLDPMAFATDSYARIAGVGPGDDTPVFPVTREETEWAAGMLGTGRWVAVAPGGARNPRDVVQRKLWPACRFREIARRLVSLGFGCVLLGDGRDRAAAYEVSHGTGHVVDLCGRATWGRSAAVLARCDAFLGVDSGAAHLATSQRTPAVVLFGPTSPEALYARGSVSVVKTTAECSPCYSNEVFTGCARRGAPCMFEIDVDAVWDSLESLLNAHSGA